MLEGQIHRQLRGHRGYHSIQAINGIGPTIAAILVAEIGDVARFRSAQALCSWAGLTPKHRESDTKTTRGSLTKQGSKLVRWALIEAVSRYHGGPRRAGDFRRIAERRGTNKARVAVARKVLTLVYYGLRDGETRCIAQAQTARGSDTTRRELVIGMTPTARGEVDELLEARLVVAGTHHARHTSAKGCLGSRAAAPAQFAMTTVRPTHPNRTRAQA